MINVTAGGAIESGLPQLAIEAGANVTITTSSGSYVVAAADSKVSSVQGKTGTVVLTVSDLSAASATHAHVAADVADLANAVKATANVLSVNGKTAAVSLVAADLTAANASHTHDASGVVSGVFDVLRIPVISYTSLSNVPSLASQTHTHGYVQILNGQTGTVTIVAGSNITVTTSLGQIVISGVSAATLSNDSPAALGVASAGGSTLVSRSDHIHPLPTAGSISAASATHTHNVTDIVDLTSVANVVSVNGITGTPSIAAGSNVTVTTAGSQITISAEGGVSASLSSASPSPLGIASAGTATLASRADHVHAMPAISYTSLSSIPPRLRWTTQTITADAHNHTVGEYEVVRMAMSSGMSLTGFADGAEGKSHRIVNVSVNPLTFKHQHTSSSATNRLLIATGLDHEIDQDDQAEFIYDPAEQRWRMMPCCTSTAVY
jgi:hypothetical protein